MDQYGPGRFAQPNMPVNYLLDPYPSSMGQDEAMSAAMQQARGMGHPAMGAGLSTAGYTLGSIPFGLLNLAGTGLAGFGAATLDPAAVALGLGGVYVGGKGYGELMGKADASNAERQFMLRNPYGTPGTPTHRGAERDSMNLENYGGQFPPRYR
ncbi:hypothetical protein [uncultured Paracoccus sp.]|uniref:hypothetical protein n=1 Tax=uncultured Paracoccus sp. TaxID=189685 RepID=UPI0026044A9E|nr:hypothetical protein [uncultured Paracoccus sp.]